MLKRFSLFLLAFIAVVAIFDQAAWAQRKPKEPAEKTVTGVVTGADGAPIPGAVVQLTNTKTLQVRSFIAMEKGQYYFNGLSSDVDYELKASANGKWSATRSVSSFNVRPEITVNLEVK